MLQGGPHGLSGHYECAKTHSLTQHVYEWTQARSRHHGIARLQVQVVLVCNSLALISSENRPRQSRHPIASHFIYLLFHTHASAVDRKMCSTVKGAFRVPPRVMFQNLLSEGRKKGGVKGNHGWIGSRGTLVI